MNAGTVETELTRVWLDKERQEVACHVPLVIERGPTNRVATTDPRARNTSVGAGSAGNDSALRWGLERSTHRPVFGSARADGPTLREGLSGSGLRWPRSPATPRAATPGDDSRSGSGRTSARRDGADLDQPSTRCVARSRARRAAGSRPPGSSPTPQRISLEADQTVGRPQAEGSEAPPDRRTGTGGAKKTRLVRARSICSTWTKAASRRRCPTGTPGLGWASANSSGTNLPLAAGSTWL